MDIVITLGRFSRCGDLEIKYALRSIEKNLTGWDKIHIVGYAPKFLSDDDRVVIKPCEDRTIRKEYNIFKKLCLACEDEGISDPFLSTQDDIFVKDKVDVSEIKNWAWKYDLKTLWSMGSGVYKIAVDNTYKYLVANGYRLNHFDLHLPILFEKDKLMNLMKVDWSQKDYLIKSLYGNINRIEIEPYNDLNLAYALKADHIRAAIKDRRIFAYSGNDGMSESMLKVLEELFPNKSSFEK